MAAVSEDIAEANRDHWDKMASQYDSKQWQIDMLEYITKQLRAHPNFFGIPKEQNGESSIRLLDYASGTGNISRALGPFVKSCLGIDISPNMVSTYNTKASGAGLDQLACHAHEGNLLSAEQYIINEAGEKDKALLNDAQFNDFDVCIIGMGFHHFENYASCIQRLSERVKPGGVVGIIDLLPKEGHLELIPEQFKHTMHVSGFTEEEMARYTKEGGLVDFGFMELPDSVYMKMKEQQQERTIFFARGRKP